MLISSYGEHVQHFKVLQDRGGQYYVWDELFTSLNELVEFYHCNSIAKERTVYLRDPEQFARVRRFAWFVCIATAGVFISATLVSFQIFSISLDEAENSFSFSN